MTNRSYRSFPQRGHGAGGLAGIWLELPQHHPVLPPIDPGRQYPHMPWGLIWDSRCSSHFTLDAMTPTMMLL